MMHPTQPAEYLDFLKSDSYNKGDPFKKIYDEICSVDSQYHKDLPILLTESNIEGLINKRMVFALLKGNIPSRQIKEYYRHEASETLVSELLHVLRNYLSPLYTTYLGEEAAKRSDIGVSRQERKISECTGRLFEKKHFDESKLTKNELEIYKKKPLYFTAHIRRSSDKPNEVTGTKIFEAKKVSREEASFYCNVGETKVEIKMDNLRCPITTANLKEECEWELTDLIETLDKETMRIFNQKNKEKIESIIKTFVDKEIQAITGSDKNIYH